MKLDFFFPVFKEDNAKEYFLKFFQTQFVKEHDFSVIFTCSKQDKKNLEFLTEQTKTNKNFVLLVLDDDFTFNDAFYYSLPYFSGDAVLLGDTKIKKIDVVFSKCLEKYKDDVKVVHVIKKAKGFKSFFSNFAKSVYNFFIKIFTNKKDRLNIISLGLIDKSVVDVLKVLPEKSCFLKNTKNLINFESRSIYIDKSVKTYEPDFKKKTPALTTAIVSFWVNIAILLFLIFGNIFIKPLKSVYNLIAIVALVSSLGIWALYLPKHFFDIRNKRNINKDMKVQKIAFEEKEKLKQKTVKEQKTKKVKNSTKSKKEKSTKTKVKKKTTN